MSLPIDFGSVPSIQTDNVGFGVKCYFTLMYTYNYDVWDSNHSPADINEYTESFICGVDPDISSNLLTANFTLPPWAMNGTFQYTVSLHLIRNPFRIPQLDRLFLQTSNIVNAVANINAANYRLSEYQTFQNWIPDGDDSWNRYWNRNGQWYGGKSITLADNANSGNATLGLFGITKNITNDGCESILLSTNSTGGSLKSDASCCMDITGLAQKYNDYKNNYMWMDYLLLPPNNQNIDPSSMSNIRDSLRKLMPVLVSQNYNMVYDGRWDGFGDCISRTWTWASTGISEGMASLNMNDYTLPIYSRMPYESPVAM